MQVPADKSRVIRFGVFEVDLQEAELRKSGLRIKLQEQPFQILTMLLERPGQTVTREELQRRLWPADTFVDFDHSLNSGIKKLREALGDDSENPRFIETLHRRGYRFIAPVDVRGAAAAERSGQVPPVANAHTESKNLARWPKWTAIAVLVIGATVLGLWLHSPLPPPRIAHVVQLTNNGRQKAGALCTDGPRLYFEEDQAIVQVSTEGGETVPVQTPFHTHGVFPMDVSPGGSELLVGTQTALETELALWIVPVLGGSPRRVGDVRANYNLANYNTAAWSPNGRNIVYARGSDLYTVKADGTGPRKLVAVNGTPSYLRWSPDGKRVSFTLFDPQDQGSAIWEVAADGRNLRQFLPGWNNPHDGCCGGWTADGKQYVFSATHENQSGLWALREETGLFHKGSYQPVPLTSGPLDFDWIVPGRDGKRIFAMATQHRGELLRFDARTRQFAPYLSGISVSDTAFSRDGEWACYVAVPEGTLWRSKLDGSQKLQLTVPPMSVTLPRWSPDGKRIVFMGQMEGETEKNYIVSADGGAPRQLISGGRNEADPQWSPDGNSILFGRLPNYWVSESSETKSLLLLDLKTNQVTEIPGTEGLYSPRWSPDGRYVATLDLDSRKLILFDLKTHQKVELATFVGGFGYPNWSHDGTWIQVVGVLAAGEKAGIYRVRLSDHKIERIVSGGELGPISGVVGGDWHGLAPDDSLLVMRDHSTTEVYALEWEAP
jgi:Tol biopolymer transport system component/DNA-binding winged helix-turn-helix (wHTH) protein